MTGPRPVPPPRPTRAVVRPTDQRPAGPGGRRPDARGGDSRGGDGRGGDGRGGDGRRTTTTAAPPSVLVRYAVHIRWATWIALVLIAIRLVAPRPDGWRRWSDAEAALTDVEAARSGALLYYAAAARQWPPPGRPGVAPSGMLPFLPGELSYGRERYRLAWEYAADTVSGARVVGISVIGDDPRLALTMAARAPDGMPFIVSGRRFIALIASATGR